MIAIDVFKKSIELKVSEEELNKRREKQPSFQPKVTEGWLARYSAFVTSADTGAVLKLPE